MTKKKKSILSDQRFIVLIVVIALTAVFSIMSKEFRQYNTLLSLLDFSYYDLLMAIRCYFPSYYRRRRPFHRNRYGMLRTDRRNSDKKPWRTCCCCYAGLCASWSSDRNTERCSYRRNESAAVSCNSLYLYDYPRCRISLYRYTVAGSYTGRWMVPFYL